MTDAQKPNATPASNATQDAVAVEEQPLEKKATADAEPENMRFISGRVVDPQGKSSCCAY